MKPTAVVTVFLVSDGKVALVKRSHRVGTYQGLWSGISGYLEGDPNRHFAVELSEETALTAGDYTLLRKAEPVSITDDEHARQWLVYPFLCEVHDPARIRLDWENTALHWVEPEQIAHLPTVPGLWEVYVQVSELAVSAAIDACVHELASDRTHGACQLALAGLDFLARLCRTSTAATAAVLTTDIKAAIERLRLVRPTMVVIDRTLLVLLNDIPDCATIDAARAGILASIEVHRQAFEQAVDRAVAQLAKIVPEGACLLLHSFSSMVVKALPFLKRQGCRLVVTESRPGFEGRVLAVLASQKGLSVRLITDASIFAMLKDVHMVLMGADAILSDGGAINKMGSGAIACCAHALGVPVYILAERRKIVPAEEAPPLEQGTTSEVWDAPPPGVMVANDTFERIPPAYIKGILLEDGIFEPGLIAQRML